MTAKPDALTANRDRVAAANWLTLLETGGDVTAIDGLAFEQLIDRQQQQTLPREVEK